jgi:hypothetical protein
VVVEGVMMVQAVVAAHRGATEGTAGPAARKESKSRELARQDAELVERHPIGGSTCRTWESWKPWERPMQDLSPSPHLPEHHQAHPEYP